MKQIHKIVKTPTKKTKIILVITATLLATCVFGQNKPLVTGSILDKKGNEPIPFASVCLADSGSSDELIPIIGTISNEDGRFSIAPVQSGRYFLLVSAVGYKSNIKNIEVTTEKNTDAGTIFLTDTAFFINEAKITGERIKGKSMDNKTVFFINKKMQAASGSAVDLLKYIPQLQVDLKQNIALNGQQDILILIDGRERDKSTINKLSPSQIDRIEILTTPPSDYDGNVSGVINVITRKNKEKGFTGKVFSEVPTSESEIYIFPMVSLTYGIKNMNIYSSYNGEINYENIDESTKWIINTNKAVHSISSVQKVRQKNLSHKFHYGIDYQITRNDIINYSGFYNPYSYEQDGEVFTRQLGEKIRTFQLLREEKDNNRSLFNSIFYKHSFDSSGSAITMDISHTMTNSSNRTGYQAFGSDDSGYFINQETPGLRSTSLKVDFQTPLGSSMNLFTGGKARFQHMYDEKSTGFEGYENILAVYGKVNLTQPKNDYTFGLRFEHSTVLINSLSDYKNTTALPFISLRHKITNKQQMTLSYRRSMHRPTIYNLNPFQYQDDPFSIRMGNPSLTPEMKDHFSLEYTLQVQSHFFSTYVFYEKTSDAINNLTVLSDTNSLITQSYNLGTIQQAGLQVSGSLRTGILSVMPNIRVYHQHTAGNDLIQEYRIANRNKLVFESNLSAIFSFKNNWAFSGIFQYATPKITLQEKIFSEALYFISLDKTFENNLKLGMVSALPLAKNFVYQGSEIKGNEFSRRYTGNLKLSAIPLMFRLSYQFSAGNNPERLQRDKEEVIRRKKPGL